MKKGVYEKYFSSSEEMVAWDNLIFCFEEKGVDKELDPGLFSLIGSLFHIYRARYTKEKEAQGCPIWREAFSISVFTDGDKKIKIMIVPEDDCYQFAASMIRSISEIDSKETFDRYIEPISDRISISESGYEKIVSKLPQVSEFLKEYRQETLDNRNSIKHI